VTSAPRNLELIFFYFFGGDSTVPLLHMTNGQFRLNHADHSRKCLSDVLPQYQSLLSTTM